MLALPILYFYTALILKGKGKKRQLGWFPASYVKLMDSIGDKSETPVETAPAASETAPATSETAPAAAETATKVKISSDPIQIRKEVPMRAHLCYFRIKSAVITIHNMF